ncbi:MAG: DNA replication/repair protein RecF [Reichenbachiella sp.]
MFLQSLKFSNFKNYVAGELLFCEHINCLVGLNGSGKTNILDAIHYLSLTKSAFNSIDSQNINHEEDFFMIKGDFVKKTKTHQVHCSIKRQGKKTFRLDDVDYSKLSQHLGLFPIVLIAPNDDDLIRESNEVRRKFFDSIIAQSDKEYLQELIKYTHHLKQRNALLKSGRVDYALLDSYDMILSKCGAIITKKRSAFIELFIPYFQENYDLIAEHKEAVTVSYHSKGLEGDLYALMKNSREKDIITQRSNVGIHRDEYVLKIDKRAIKKYGSQGQQKSMLISLKLAQFSFIKNQLGITPILLLDDIFDKLDDHRIAQLLSIITSDQFKQIFITDAREERTISLLKGKYDPMKIFRVDNGSIKEVG